MLIFSVFQPILIMIDFELPAHIAAEDVPYSLINIKSY